MRVGQFAHHGGVVPGLEEFDDGDGARCAMCEGRLVRAAQGGPDDVRLALDGGPEGPTS